MKDVDNDVVFNGLPPPSQGKSPSSLNRHIQGNRSRLQDQNEVSGRRHWGLTRGQISFDKRSPSSGTSISTGPKNLGSNPQGPNEDIRKEEGTSCQFLDDDSTIQFDKCERITDLVVYSPWEFYFKKNNLKVDEYRAIEEFNLSSPERIIASVMCGRRWRRSCNISILTLCQGLYLGLWI